MPARVIVVLDEPGFATTAAAEINAAGYDAVALPDSMAGVEALKDAHRIELLITCPDFAEGKPNGISLALMARARRPGLKVLFIGDPGMERFTAGVGTLMVPPATTQELVEKARDMLEASALPSDRC